MRQCNSGQRPALFHWRRGSCLAAEWQILDQGLPITLNASMIGIVRRVVSLPFQLRTRAWGVSLLGEDVRLLQRPAQAIALTIAR